MKRAGIKLYDDNGYFVAEVRKEVGDGVDVIQFEDRLFVRKAPTQFRETTKLRVYGDEVRRL